jgi:chorismate dehydratase
MNLPVQSFSRSSPTRATLRIASVSYLNARPLIYGLDDQSDRELLLEVPAKLIDLLREDRADVALLPVIDYQRMDDLCIVPSGGIGSDGETLTVRVFSRTPIDRIEALACDTESHTSVALVKIILAEQFGVKPTFVDLRASDAASQNALLLIGDKVICAAPENYEYQLDLGAAWKKLTGLPFVFATWMARRGTDLQDLPQQLERAKRAGLENIDQLIDQYAVPRGWPRELARQYLTKNLAYDIGEEQLRAIRLFHELAHKHRVIEQAKILQIYNQQSH